MRKIFTRNVSVQVLDLAEAIDKRKGAGRRSKKKKKKIEGVDGTRGFISKNHLEEILLTYGEFDKS